MELERLHGADPGALIGALLLNGRLGAGAITSLGGPTCGLTGRGIGICGATGSACVGAVCSGTAGAAATRSAMVLMPALVGGKGAGSGTPAPVV